MRLTKTEVALVLAIGAAMSVLGVYAWAVVGIASPRHPFAYFGFVPASCATWLLLAHVIRGRSLAVALVAGLLSPFLGVILWVLLGSVPGIIRRPQVLEMLLRAGPGLVLQGWKFAFTSGWVTFPIGVITGLIVWTAMKNAHRLTFASADARL